MSNSQYKHSDSATFDLNRDISAEKRGFPKTTSNAQTVNMNNRLDEKRHP